MYTAMYCLGAIAAILTVVFRCKQYNAPPVRTTVMETIVVLVAVLSGKLLFGLEEVFYGNPFSVDGIRIYGLIFSVPITCLILHKFSRLKWADALAICTPGLAMSSVFARIGCHFAGCCGGPPIKIGQTMIDVPEQLVEGAMDLTIFCLLLLLEKKHKEKFLYPVYLGSYAIVRFFLDFLRDSPKVFINLTLAQWISIAAVFLSLLWMILLCKIDSLKLFALGKEDNK